VKNFLVLVLILIPGALNATNYYVAAIGNDNNPGTITQPWKTIAKVNSSMAIFKGDDIIFFNRGDSWTSSTITIGTAGTFGHNIVISAYGTGAKPILQGVTGNPAITVTAGNRGYWTIDGLDLRGTGVISGYACSLALYFNYWDSGQPGNVPGWVIKNCTFNACMLVSGPNILIQDNTFNGTGNANNIYGAIVVRGPYGDGAIIERNTISNYIDRGVWITEGSPNATVRNNIIYNITIGADNPGACINIDGYATPCINAKVYGNTLHDCVRGVIHENAYGCETYNNLVYNAEGGFSSMFYSSQYGTASNIKIHHNIIHDVTFGFILWNTRDISILNNTIYQGVGATTAGLVQYADNANVSNITFANNIISGTWTYPIWNYLTDAIFTQLDYNLIVPNGTELLYMVYSFYSLANLQAQGLMTHSITSDPGFVSAGSDFHLQAGSPAIGKGITISGITTDYAGTALKNPPSIGAYESGSVVSAPAVPVYQSSAIANATPSLLEMTYNMSLANIVPASSSFSVLVNSLTRTISRVVISGTKVQLTLSSAIKLGDIIIVSYTKPASNPLQSTTGGVGTSISARPVTNNLINEIKDAAPVTVTMTLSPYHVHGILNVLLAYSSTPTNTMSPEIIQIADLSGVLFIKKLLVTGITNIKIPLNLDTGIYTVVMLGNGIQLASQKMIVY
jgi:uncharacterized repeat protein (TIGR02059 family)